MTQYRLRHSRFHAKLEEFSVNLPPNLDLDSTLELLGSGKNLTDIAKDTRVLQDPHEEHVQREEWYGPRPGGNAREVVVRREFEELITLYQRQPRPVRTIWLQGGDEFAIITDETERQITRIVITPHQPPNPDHLPQPGRTKLFVELNGEPEVHDPYGKF